MELQRSQLYSSNNQFAFEAKSIKKNADPNEKSLRIKKVRPEPKKLPFKTGPALKGAISQCRPMLLSRLAIMTILKGGGRVASILKY